MTNWRTTVAGIVAGLGPVLDGLSSMIGGNQPIHWSSLLMGVGVIVLGALTRDAKASQPTTSTDH